MGFTRVHKLITLDELMNRISEKRSSTAGDEYQTVCARISKYSLHPCRAYYFIIQTYRNRREGRKEMFYLTQHILFTVIWRRTYGK